MALTEVKLRCPDCGSEDIKEWAQTAVSYEIVGAGHYDDGQLGLEYGNSETSENAFLEGYACAEYCAGRTFPTIDRFIVKEEDR